MGCESELNVFISIVPSSAFSVASLNALLRPVEWPLTLKTFTIASLMNKTMPKTGIRMGTKGEGCLMLSVWSLSLRDLVVLLIGLYGSTGIGLAYIAMIINC